MATATTPDAPTNVIVTAGNAQFTITWTAPTYDGGSAIIGYNVSTNIGSFTLSTFVDGSTTTETITELYSLTEVVPIGTAFTFIVVAINAIGNSDPASSLSMTLIRIPDAPTNVTASAGNSQVTLNWTAPTNNGGSAITSYSVTSSPGNFQATTADGLTTTATVTGLTNGIAYTFTVVATNVIGNSKTASSLSIIPRTIPGAPTNVTASAGNSQVTLNWTAPTNNGGSAITSYSVTSSPGNFQATTTDGLTTSATVTGLTNGIAYTFTVVATNIAGSSTGSIPINVATYENFNSSSSSFRIFCDKLTSNDIYENLILESTNNNIEFKVAANKKIIFNNPIVLNNVVNLNNKGLTGLTTISAENLSINTEVLNTNINIVYKSFFNNNSIYSNTFLTNTTILQDLSNSLFNTIDISNNSSILVNVNITLYYSYAINENITVELWRDTSMIVQSKNLGCANSAGGIVTPYSLTYLDTSLNAGPKKYYIKYKLENNISLIRQGIINLLAGSDSNIILTEIENASNYYNKVLFTNSSYTTTSYEIQDLSAVLYNIIDVSNSNVHITINANLYCSYSFNERIIIEVWRDASMIAQSKKLGTVNATAGLTIPYSFSYLDTNLRNGPKKYYLKYKLEKDPSSNASVSIEPQGIVNISTSNSIGTSNILLTNVPKNNSNLTTMAGNSFLTSTSDLQDLSGQLYNNIEISVPSAVLVDLNFTLYACYAGNERITIQLWRDLFMVSENLNIGTTNATGGSNLNFRLSLLDEMVSGGLTKYYIKYKLETNNSAQPQGIINVQGTYTIIEDYNRGIFLYYKILSYNVMDYTNGYVKNTSIGYNPIIAGDKGAASGRQPAYFTYIDVSGAVSSFNNSLYVKNNLFVDGSASITSDLSVNGFSQASMLSKLSLINDYISNMTNTRTVEFSNNSISTRDLSAHNITVSNELYALAKYYTNDLNINGQLLSNVLRVPHEFTLDPYGYNNASGSLIINGNLIVRGNRKIIKSSIVDISSFTLKVANNLRNKADLSSNPGGLDISNVASLKYDGSTWNISGGNLLIGNLGVGYDVSLINLQTTISASLIASKLKYDTSFSILQTNIDNSFNKLVYYSKGDVDNSFSIYTDFSNLKNYIDLSFVTKQTYSLSGNAIIQNYVSKAYVDGSFLALNNKLALFALKKNVEISYNDLSGQIIRSFANVSATNVDISSITIENIKTPRLTLTSHVSINSDLVVAGDTSSNALAISNSFTFNNNGYSSVYFTSSSPTAIMEEYFSKFNNYGISVFYISADGSLYNLNNSRGAISDSRLKENIVDASPKLEDLLKVRIVDYNLKANSSKKYIGVLAQELEELFPALVETESPSAHDIENGKTIKYKSVKYSCFNVMLIKALQEQQQIIDNLTLRLERLKEKKERK